MKYRSLRYTHLRFFGILFLALMNSSTMSNAAQKRIGWAVSGIVEPIHVEMAKKFNSQNREWTVEPISYTSQSELLDLLLDSQPDVLTLSPRLAIEYIDIGILPDIRQYYKPNDTFYTDVMTAFGKNFNRKGKIHALPFWGNMATLNFNSDIFSMSGMPLPQPSWRYENELYNALKKLTKDQNGDGKPEQFGMVGGVHNEWLPVFYSWGAEFLSLDGLKLLFTDKAAVESLTYVQKLHIEHLVEARSPEIEFEPAFGPFIDKRSSMIIDYRMWDERYIKKLSQSNRMKVDNTSTPYGKKGNISVATSQAIGIYVQSPNKDGAAAFLKFLFDVENQVMMYKEGGGFPTRKNVFRLARLGSGQQTSSTDPIAAAYERAKVMGADDISQTILQAVDYGIYEMVHQGKTPLQLIQQAKDEFYRLSKERLAAEK